MAITAALVKELRERTGAGMMECKKALVETNGDIETAIDNMRVSGQAKAAKKAGRIAAEGVIVARVSESGDYGVVLEINSETDFVARDVSFLAFANDLAELVLNTKTTDVEALLATQMASGQTVAQAREALVSKIGENIQVRRAASVSAPIVTEYLHGGKIGVLVGLEGEGNAELAKDVAMHIAATNPEVINPEEVSNELLEKEKEIFSAQARESGKPEAIIEKMIEGRMQKFVAEVSLTGQPFVKNPSITVGKLLESSKAKATQFIRFGVGDGIEKKVEDFAAEVAAVTGGN
ncbi:MAG: elongation factor Ts [Gammaproteobacteria bacterium CG22_combo_CG10-13_8_21_14_all_40_8]|nr:MAG: elongation factor Ts [Gammaproteobacteria bacterium CG22_combo_CG10-13_8_21_14_all_40_8]